ncbi:uncharacterized protein LOC114459646 [Gouania willdenowi]|uniref:uncharacterized protein LOC114459646 n=1 Tax=Gouania willdenowi TaxID=441366 RepID=UPI001054910C|nr:uncharacterized protein LOC114459646 [Gouania willdenowi]
MPPARPSKREDSTHSPPPPPTEATPITHAPTRDTPDASTARRTAAPATSPTQALFGRVFSKRDAVWTEIGHKAMVEVAAEEEELEDLSEEELKAQQAGSKSQCIPHGKKYEKKWLVPAQQNICSIPYAPIQDGNDLPHPLALMWTHPPLSHLVSGASWELTSHIRGDLVVPTANTPEEVGWKSSSSSLLSPGCRVRSGLLLVRIT